MVMIMTGRSATVKAREGGNLGKAASFYSPPYRINCRLSAKPVGSIQDSYFLTSMTNPFHLQSAVPTLRRQAVKSGGVSPEGSMRLPLLAAYASLLFNNSGEVLLEADPTFLGGNFESPLFGLGHTIECTTGGHSMLESGSGLLKHVNGFANDGCWADRGRG
jgi:hypothetical protein